MKAGQGMMPLNQAIRLRDIIKGQLIGIFGRRTNERTNERTKTRVL